MEKRQCINFLLSRTQQSVQQFFKARLVEFDVTPVQYLILSCLWYKDRQTAKQIAQNINLDSTITGILDRMENKGLIKRTSDADDRRAIRIVLTEKGAQLKEPIEQIIDLSHKELLKVLTIEEQEQFRDFLRRVFKSAK